MRGQSIFFGGLMLVVLAGALVVLAPRFRSHLGWQESQRNPQSLTQDQSSIKHEVDQTSCLAESQVVLLEIEGFFDLNIGLVEAAYPDSQNQMSFFERSIQQHIQFLIRSIRHDFNDLGLKITFSVPPYPVIRQELRHSRSDLKYEMSSISHPDVKIAEPYLVQAMAEQVIASSSPVLEIHYTTSVKAVLCGDPEELEFAEVSSTTAPADPWLAHWMLPPSLFKDTRWRQARFKIPPFADGEYADIPDPTYLWYFWNPRESGKDVHGRKFEAQKLLIPGRHILENSFDIVVSKSLPTGDFGFDTRPWQDKETIKVTAIFGIIDMKASDKLNTRVVFEKLPPSGGETEWDSLVSTFQERQAGTVMDRGSVYAMDFIRLLAEVVRKDSIDYQWQSSQEVLSISSKLIMSDRPVEIRFFFGPTDALVAEPPRHWKLAASALADDDFVFYIGHSGLGENFKIANIQQGAGMESPLQVGTRNQLIGIFSCYSYHYFGGSLVESSADPTSLQIILTGSNYTSARGPLGTLDYLDKRLAGRENSNFRYLFEDDFLILTKAE